MMDVTDGVDTVNLPAFYASFSDPIPIPSGFPFGNSVQDEVYVSSYCQIVKSQCYLKYPRI